MAKLRVSKQMWMRELSEELSELTGNEITVERLAEQMIEFREKTSDVYLRDSYPKAATISTEWAKDMGIHDRPNRPNHDFILSFLDRVYPGRDTSLAMRICESMDAHVEDVRPRTELGRIIEKENYRRSRVNRSGVPSEKSYWHNVSSHIQDKYAGTYILARMSGDEMVVVEGLAIEANVQIPSMLTIRWIDRHQSRWVGNLYINPRKFAGSVARCSSDRLLEPVTVSLLRTPRINDKSELILTGVINGWVDGSDELFMSSKMFAWKIPRLGPAASFEDIETAFRSKLARDRIQAIEFPGDKREAKLGTYFENKSFKTGNLSASTNWADFFNRD